MLSCENKVLMNSVNNINIQMKSRRECFCTWLLQRYYMITSNTLELTNDLSSICICTGLSVWGPHTHHACICTGLSVLALIHTMHVSVLACLCWPSYTPCMYLYWPVCVGPHTHHAMYLYWPGCVSLPEIFQNPCCVWKSKVGFKS